jgi:hypothetical protein
VNAVIDWVNTGATWFAVAALGWLAVGLVVALLIGRVIRVREQQVPQDAARSATPPETTELSHGRQDP